MNLSSVLNGQFCFYLNNILNCSLQSILTEVDALIYVDTDVLFLSPPEHLWNYFRQFNASQEMAASKARQYVDPKELMKKGIPVLTKDGKTFYCDHVSFSSGINTYKESFFQDARVYKMHFNL